MMFGNEVRERYFEWLLSIVDGADWAVICDILHHCDFYSPIEFDENRACDGLDLRRRFLNIWDDRIYQWGPCSIFEAIVGLCLRLNNDILYAPDKPNEQCWVFREMLKGVGLDGFTDSAIGYGRVKNVEQEVKFRVYRALDRRIGFDGTGGFFPLNCTKFDQRQEELWSQANQYLNENYF